LFHVNLLLKNSFAAGITGMHYFARCTFNSQSQLLAAGFHGCWTLSSWNMTTHPSHCRPSSSSETHQLIKQCFAPLFTCTAGVDKRV